METKPKKAPKPLTKEQEAILSGLKSSLAVLPVGADGRPSSVHRKQRINNAAIELASKGMNRFAARRVAEAAAGSVASRVHNV